MTEPVHYGLKVGHLPMSNGSVLYAELEPRNRTLRHPGTWLGGWWFEVHTTATPEPELIWTGTEHEQWSSCGAHWYLHDGDALTYRGAVHKASSELDALHWQDQFADHKKNYPDWPYDDQPHNCMTDHYRAKTKIGRFIKFFRGK